MQAEQGVVVVTGAASGIGAALAERLAAAGRTVIGIDVNPCSGTAFIEHDVADADGAEPLIEQIEAEHGPLWGLANVAGISMPESALELTLPAFRRQLAVMLEGPVFLGRAAARRMVNRGGGRIVNVSSIHSTHGEAASLAYDAAKAALEAATRALAIECGAAGVLVNSVAPGFTRTPMSIVDGRDELESDPFRRVYIEAGKLPLRRAAEPQEVAAAIAWLLSGENTYVTGSRLVVDGGLTATF